MPGGYRVVDASSVLLFRKLSTALQEGSADKGEKINNANVLMK